MPYSYFPHVINLTVQAIYAALKDGKGLKAQYLLGNLDCINKAALDGMVLPQGVTKDDYLQALAADVLGTAQKLITTCCISGRHREEFLDTIFQGNLDETWTDDNGNQISRKALQLLRDCEIWWSSMYLMVDQVLVIEEFSQHPDLLDANISIPSAAEVCVLNHIWDVMSVPYDAQESLSSNLSGLYS
ncbi:hypothetical protein BDM02DRAFT_3192232 [Thelephora ganbajun]|uniref:Uncharacterized protein n=1 Tax=Thelephora ganbajun TaxID=370292 RepID=A0ACB6Z0W0_THEGA|nr:hypothetical protein BDM02DRAFT_3192232 [Thelephora ganbajun]